MESEAVKKKRDNMKKKTLLLYKINPTKANKQKLIAKSAGAVEYTDCISPEGYQQTSVLNMTLNNQKLRFQ